MAGFCTKCGKPLPENGVCDCAQQPQYQPYPQQPAYVTAAPQGPSPVAVAMNTIKNYLKDPMGTTRGLAEKQDQKTGITLMIAILIATFLSTFFLCLRFKIEGANLAILGWLITGIFAPAIGVAVTGLAAFLICKLNKLNPDLKSLIAIVGATTIFPLLIVTAGIPLSMIHIDVYGIVCKIAYITWAVVCIATLVDVLKIRLNLVNILVVILCLVVASYAVGELHGWFNSEMYGTFGGYSLNDMGDIGYGFDYSDFF